MRAWLLALALCVLPGVASADAIGPPMPRECPAGSTARTNHCGTVCSALPCTTDADCGDGQRCLERPLCVEEVPCGGYGATFSIVHAACPSGACAEGSCDPVRSCGPGNSEPDGGGGTGATDAGTHGEHVRWGCGCGVSQAGSSGLLGLLLVALAVLLRRRARRR